MSEILQLLKRKNSTYIVYLVCPVQVPILDLYWV